MPESKKRQTGLLDTWGRRNRKLADRICPQCQETFHPLRQASKYCSRRCAWANNGKNQRKTEYWWTTNQGYIHGRIWLPDGTQIRVQQHRFIMEGLINRPLKATEDVHHINGDKADNRPENLELLDHSEHTRRSNNSRTYKKGYKQNLTEAARKALSFKAIAQGLAEMGRAAKVKGAKSKTKGESQ